MSAWPGKYVIGLTGNIATGKSVVRKILEHMGAYAVDADSLSHRAMAKGAPAYQPILDYFGRWVLGDDEQIDRAKLGKLAFADPESMAKLEEIVHPFVRQAVDILVRRADQKVVVIEAIKLLEGPLKDACDAIWVTNSDEKNQLLRLIKRRGMSEADARTRIVAQPSQKDKLAAASEIIENDGSFEDLWRVVVAAWEKISPTKEETAPVIVKPAEPTAGAITVQRARPNQAEQIAQFITQITQGKVTMTRLDVMAAFGEKAFMLLMQDEKVVGLVGWQVENLVSRIIDFYLAPIVSFEASVPDLMERVEEASRQLQSEAALLFVKPDYARNQAVWQKLGFEPRTAESLQVRAWQEAARDSHVDGTVMLFKQLRTDRVLRPM